MSDKMTYKINENVLVGEGIEGDDDRPRFIVGRLEPLTREKIKPTKEEIDYMEEIKSALESNPHARRDKTEDWDKKPKNEGLRYDAGKNRLELTPPEWEWALANVGTEGSLKYAERNWEKGMKWSKMVGCVKRHLNKFLAGERYDPETGCHHLAMAAWNLLALMTYDLRGIGENDLPKEVQLELFDRVNAKTSDLGATVE